MTPRHPRHDEPTPINPSPSISRKGVTIPWAWLLGCAPLAAMGGALGHAQVFGAPPEFAQGLAETKAQLLAHEHRITEQEKVSAVNHEVQARLLEDVRRILTILEHRQ